MQNMEKNMAPPEPPKDENGRPLPPPENGEAPAQPATDEAGAETV